MLGLVSLFLLSVDLDIELSATPPPPCLPAHHCYRIFDCTMTLDTPETVNLESGCSVSN